MNDVEVRVSPEVEDFLEILPSTLVNEGYKSDFANAVRLIDDIVDFIYTIPNIPHHTVLPEFEYHFMRYGKKLKYVFFKRQKSPRTTWYIFFQQYGNRILVKHITNNWVEGQYIR